VTVVEQSCSDVASRACTVVPDSTSSGQDRNPMTKIYEVSLVPRSKAASIVYIVVRIDDPLYIDTHEKCMNFIEEQFPFYEVKEVLEGFKQ
jgi:hypothetical protein